MSNEQSYQDFYARLRSRVREWEGSSSHPYADFILMAPDLVHVLIKLTLDSRVSAGAKAKIAVALAYFISPVDLIPEAIVGPIGYIDDVAVAAYVLNELLNGEHASYVHEHWQGNKNVMNAVQTILEVADTMIGAGMWRQLKKQLGLS